MFSSNRKEQTRSILPAQFKQLLPILLIMYTPALGAILALVFVTWSTGLPVSYFTRDVAAISGQKFYVGAYSYIGILLWCACTAICFFSYAALRKNIRNRQNPSFFLFSGLLSFIILLDDLFQVHEVVFPDYLNLSENSFYVGYIVILLLFFIKFFKTIIKTNFIFLLLALGFFGISVIVDIFGEFYLADEDSYFLLEDGFKLLGIVSWVTYFTIVALNQVKGTILSLQAGK